STGGHRLAGANPWIGTTICTGNSPKADHELRLKPDHPMGSGQFQHRERWHVRAFNTDNRRAY
ncbi:hypothetical protein KDW49_28980, partial [Burkholderia dolosa]|uniref:hypothetical protein n=1 Tax=Burkholderia dolosa TaxID=152500 RepID=UPI001B9F10AD